MSPITSQIPDYLRAQVERLSTQKGLSVNQSFATAAPEKIAALEAVDYIQNRAAQATDEAFLEAVSHIPAVPVKESWDQLP